MSRFYGSLCRVRAVMTVVLHTLRRHSRHNSYNCQ